MRGRTLGIKAKSFAPRAASYRSCRGVCGDCVGDERCGGCWPWGCRRARAFASRAGLPQKLPGGGMRRLRRRSALRRMLCAGLPKSQSTSPEGGPPTEAAGGYAEIASQNCVAADVGRGVAKEREHSPRGRASHRSCRGVCGIASETSVAVDAVRGVARGREHSPRGRASHRSCRGICGDCVAEVRCSGCCARGCQRARAFAPRAGLPQKL